MLQHESHLQKLKQLNGITFVTTFSLIRLRRDFKFCAAAAAAAAAAACWLQRTVLHSARVLSLLIYDVSLLNYQLERVSIQRSPASRRLLTPPPLPPAAPNNFRRPGARRAHVPHFNRLFRCRATTMGAIYHTGFPFHT